MLAWAGRAPVRRPGISRGVGVMRVPAAFNIPCPRIGSTSLGSRTRKHIRKAIWERTAPCPMAFCVAAGSRDKGNRDCTAKPGDGIGIAHRAGRFVGQLGVLVMMIMDIAAGQDRSSLWREPPCRGGGGEPPRRCGCAVAPLRMGLRAGRTAVPGALCVGGGGIAWRPAPADGWSAELAEVLAHESSQFRTACALW